jgi:PAS domain S-box-containing protein
MEGRLCLPVTTASGKRAALNATINATAVLSDVIADVRPGRTGYTWAVDRDGLFLFHPDGGLIGQNAFAGFDNQSSRGSYAGISRITEDQVTSGEPGTGTYVSGWHGAEEMEVPKLVAFAPVTGPILPPARPWIIAVATPVTEVAESVHDIEARHIAAEAAIIGGMFLFGLLVLAYQRRRSQTLREEVTEKEKVLASILRSSVDAIIFIDNQNHVQVWNKGAELVFGYTAEEMIGQSFHRLIPPEIDADEELNRITEEVRRVGYIRNYRAQRITRAGKRITVDISRTIIIGEDGSPLGSTAIIKDITEKEEMDKLIYSTEKLASIGTLAAGVAHEINNPLGVILGFTDLLRERFTKGSPEYNDLVIIEENANNAKRIVEDMLGFARVTEGLEDSVDIGHCIDRVLSIAEVTLKQDDIRIVADVAENLPDVQGDAREFQQVAFNLISNAMDAMAGTGGTLTVRAWHDNDRVYFSVSDTGVGIPDRLKGQIFDPFFTTKKVGKGTGLGLSLCYGIVKKHGGTIEFASISKQDHPDQTTGTTFTVTMPVVKSENENQGEN